MAVSQSVSRSVGRYWLLFRAVVAHRGKGRGEEEARLPPASLPPAACLPFVRR